MFMPSPGVYERGFEGLGKWSLEVVEAGDDRWWHSPAGTGLSEFWGTPESMKLWEWE